MASGDGHASGDRASSRYSGQRSSPAADPAAGPELTADDPGAAAGLHAAAGDAGAAGRPGRPGPAARRADHRADPGAACAAAEGDTDEAAAAEGAGTTRPAISPCVQRLLCSRFGLVYGDSHESAVWACPSDLCSGSFLLPVVLVTHRTRLSAEENAAGAGAAEAEGDAAEDGAAGPSDPGEATHCDSNALNPPGLNHPENCSPLQLHARPSDGALAARVWPSPRWPHWPHRPHWPHWPHCPVPPGERLQCRHTLTPPGL